MYSTNIKRINERRNKGSRIWFLDKNQLKPYCLGVTIMLICIIIEAQHLKDTEH